MKRTTQKVEPAGTVTNTATEYSQPACIQGTLNWLAMLLLGLY